jgi:hypothetical protein
MRGRGADLPWVAVALALGLACAAPARADLKAAQAEPDLEKRSDLALANAPLALKAARQAYDAGDNAKAAAAVAEIEESVELAYKSLEQTGKNPRNHPKYFKKAEIETRDLLRRLDAFQQEMSFADRSMLDAVKARVQQVHDDLLVGLMEGKRK